MRKSSSKALLLGAIAALTVVGGGLISPARAGWQPLGAGSYATTDAPQAVAETLATVTEDHPSNPEQITTNPTLPASTRQFVWQSTDGSVPSYYTRVPVQGQVTLNWPHEIQINKQQGGTAADCWVNVGDRDSQAGFGYSYRASYDYATHLVTFMNDGPDVSSHTLQKNMDITALPESDGSTGYYLNCNFQLQLSNYAAVSSDTAYDDNGNTINLFLAKSTSGATTATTTSIQIAP